MHFPLHGRLKLRAALHLSEALHHPILFDHSRRGEELQCISLSPDEAAYISMQRECWTFIMKRHGIAIAAIVQLAEKHCV